MREFFRGWRRKVGCVALVMACALTGMWVRSHVYLDYIKVPFRRVLYSSGSNNGALFFGRGWSTHGDITKGLAIDWKTGKRRTDYPPPNGLFEWRNVEESDRASPYQTIFISHLSIAIPLSVLSAYLILWPGKRVPNQVTSTHQQEPTMREFFHGWRRKVGCVTLVMALAMMAGWIRSRQIHDVVAFPLLGRQHAITIASGRIYWTGMARDDGEWLFESFTEIINSPAEVDFIAAGAQKTYGAIEELQFADLMISHWSLVIPLTILSAYLLLWKPRKKPKEQSNA